MAGGGRRRPDQEAAGHWRTKPCRGGLPTLGSVLRARFRDRLLRPSPAGPLAARAGNGPSASSLVG